MGSPRETQEALRSRIQTPDRPGVPPGRNQVGGPGGARRNRAWPDLQVEDPARQPGPRRTHRGDRRYSRCLARSGSSHPRARGGAGGDPEEAGQAGRLQRATRGAGKKNGSELSVREKVEFVRRHQARIGSVQGACQVIGLSPSTYYAKPKVPREQRERQRCRSARSDRARAGGAVADRLSLCAALLASLGSYCGRAKIRRIMKKYGLHAKLKRAFVATTDSEHSHRVYPNLFPEEQ